MTPGNRHLEAGALSCQAVLEAMRGRADAARSMLDGCRATFEELGLGLELLENELHAGIVELLDDDPAAAEARLRAAYDGFAALGAGATPSAPRRCWRGRCSIRVVTTRPTRSRGSARSAAART